MIRVDDFLDRVPSHDYKCFDFVREVWWLSFSEDIGDQLTGLTRALHERKILPSEMRLVKKLHSRVDPCVVVMQRGRTEPHIGIWYGGRVLHLAPTGAQYVPLNVAARRYPKVSFYR